MLFLSKVFSISQQVLNLNLSRYGVPCSSYNRCHEAAAAAAVSLTACWALRLLRRPADNVGYHHHHAQRAQNCSHQTFLD
jgi:hypothetical protein